MRMTITDNIIYLKLCWTRALGHANIPRSIFETGGIAYLLIDAADATYTQRIIALVIAGVLIIALFCLGHWDLKHGLMKKETSLSNQFNPELMSLMKSSKKEDKVL